MCKKKFNQMCKKKKKNLNNIYYWASGVSAMSAITNVFYYAKWRNVIEKVVKSNIQVCHFMQIQFLFSTPHKLFNHFSVFLSFC